MFSTIFPILIFLVLFFNLGSGFELKIECDGPIVLGATLNCTTWVFKEDGKTLADGKFKYAWKDDAIPPNNRLMESGPNVDTWSVSYNSSIYTAGGYVIRVDVCEWILGMFCTYQNSAGTFFMITESLNGNIILAQKNETRDSYISTSEALNIAAALKPSDKDYISKAPSVLSYWFIDCVYYGITTDLQFDYNFTKPDENHLIESLVVGDFTPLPPPTTVPPPTTTKIITTTTSTAKPPITSSTTVKPPSSKSKRAINNHIVKDSILFVKNASSNDSQSNNNIKVWENGVLVPYNGSFPYVCNSTVITTDSYKVYGYFQKVITSKAPISNITVSGNNWLQQGEILSLNVNCKGSEKMQFCVDYKRGLYNVTGNETCREYDELDTCDFPINRYLQDQHTVIIIIKNDVSKKVTSVAVTIYKVKQQAQLSVIVIPVVFGLIAGVTIVFGVAYYLQNRSRFIVEVADFDFGPKYADMEYKTFKDRLKDSIMHAFTRDPMPSASDAPIWPPGHKYGSMT